MSISTNSISYAFRDAVHNLKVNSLMTSASVIVLVACIVITGSSLLISVNINRLVSKMEDQNEIVAFVDDSATENDISKMLTDIYALDNIEKVNYVTKEQALAEYKAEYADQAALLDGLAENPLRNSFHVKIKDLTLYESSVAGLKGIEHVANVREKKELVSKIVNLKKILTILSLWVIGILLFMSIFIISNTVRLAMFTRKLEINIMKFVGATDNFIRLPFLFEGIVLGAFSGIVSLAVQWYLYSKIIVPLLNDLSLFSPLLFSQMWTILVPAFILSGIIIGVIGSIVPMRKYLKV